VLHDTIEDTTTDFEDIVERFGPDIAGWVADLTKDMRLPEAEREAVYRRRLAAAGWQVAVCKLADVYDNLGDSSALGPGHRRRTAERSRAYLDTLRQAAHPEAAAALAVVADRLAAVERDLSPEKVG
jgi:(p)ppGpp synthase/HD superfamily hydrolase